MGANPTQAYGVIVFFLAFVALAAAFALGGSTALLIIAVVLLGGAVAICLKCKPWENAED
ncbi:MAG TPA: hypothetical protein VK335_19345 [Bryobacteraceae bacterium]|nr:hypothetical protein [Bryobacteraceae bacterium]